MSRRLRNILDVAHECEKDYFRQNTCNDCKPQFCWLEEGLFSGSAENALPAEVTIVESAALADGFFRITVRFTYRETFATYGRPPDPDSHYEWPGAVIVDCTGDQCLVDDFVRIDTETGRSYLFLSRSFTGCEGSRWVGESR